MGQRVNYILKNNDEINIFYHNWRATNILSDLYTGQLEFINFVHRCAQREAIMDNIWIEGCVIIDVVTSKVYFWTVHVDNTTSVMEYYLGELNKKWAPWSVVMLHNQMYDVETILGIDYMSKQEKFEGDTISEVDIINNTIEKYESTLVIIKQQNNLFVTKTAGIYASDIITFGETIVPLLLQKPSYELPQEGASQTSNTIFIDTTNKHIIINECIPFIWEMNSEKWSGYTFMMGDYGYFHILRLAGLATEDLKMPQHKIVEAFNKLVKPTDSFNPFEFAKSLLQDNNNIQFNPNFFDNEKP